MERVTPQKDLFFAALIALAIHAVIVFTYIIPFAATRPLNFKTESYGRLNISMVTTETEEMEKSSVVSVAQPEKKAVVNKEKKIIKPDQKAIIETLSEERLELPSENLLPVKETNRPSVVSAKGGAEAAKVVQAVPRYNENTPPIYPAVARRKGYEGVVLLLAEILVNGSVGDVKIKRSSGHEILDRSALKAVKKWKFEPARRMDCPVVMWVEVPVRFVLNDTSVGQ